MEHKQIRVAIVGISFPAELRAIVKQFDLVIQEVKGESGELKREFATFQPNVIFVEASMLTHVYAAVPSANRPSIFVASREDARDFPPGLESGLADDMVLLPLRPLDFLARLRWHQHLHALRSVEGLNDSVRRLVQKVEEDIVFAQKIQRRLIKDRFPPMQGITVKSRYWCGLRSGGDYFDVFDFVDKNYLGFLLTDASTYSLSTAFLNAMIHLPAKLAPEEIRNPVRMVSRICEGIGEAFTEKDQLSIFYGVLDRRSYVLDYISFGKLFAALQRADGRSQWLVDGNDAALTAKTLDLLKLDRQRQVGFEPEDRFCLFSDGVEEILDTPLANFLAQIEDRDPQIVLNEISFALRTKQDPEGAEALAGEQPMPPQDCSVLLIDVAKNVLRLAR